MKVLHTADWHIGQFKGPVEDGVNLRSLDTVKCLEYMVEMAREEKPDLVCISGDVFHQEQIGPVRYSDEMVTATRIIDELSKVSKFVVVMRGTPNHDGAGQFRVLTKMLEHNKKVAVVTTPQVISTPIADIVCIPGFDKQEFRAKFPGLSAEEENLTWTNHISEMVMGLRAQCSQTNIVADMVPAILMAHYTVPGCNMESGQTSFFSNFEPVIPREALQTARFDAVLLGHIHRPQMLEGLESVFYSGAINAMNFNDEGQKRGFWIHEFEKKILKKGHLYETPYRKFQTIKWDKEDVAEYLRSGKMYLLEKDYAWDKLIAEPFSEWWDSSGKQKIMLKAEDIGKGLGSGISAGILTLLGIDVGSTIDEGATIGRQFASGFVSGFNASEIQSAIGGAISGIFKNAGKIFTGDADLSSWLSAALVAKVATPLLGAGIKGVKLGKTIFGSGEGGLGLGSAIIGSAAAGTGLKGLGASAGMFGLKIGSTATTGAGLIASGAAAAGGGIVGGATLISGGIDAYHAIKSDEAAEKKAYGTSAGLKVGGVAGGAALGAAIGSVIPGLGTVVGGLIGAGIGGIAGWFGGNKVKEDYEETKQAAEEAALAAELMEQKSKYALEGSRFENSKLKDAFNDTTVSAERFASMMQEAASKKVQDSFGNIKLSVKEIKDAAKQIVFGDQEQAFTKFSSAASEAQNSLSNLQSSVSTMDKLNWKASLGMKFDDNEISEYIAGVDNMLSSASQYLEDKHYQAKAAIDLLVEPGNETDMTTGLNAMYADMQSKIESLGKDLHAKVNVALEDGVITLDEQAEITNLQNQITDITNQISQAETEASFQSLKIKYSGASLDADSFANLVAEIQTNVQEAAQSYDDALEVSLTNLNLQLQSGAINQEQFDAQLQALTEGYQAKITDLSVRVESFELQSIADAFGSEVDGILPDIEGTVAEKLGTAMHNAMAAGVDVENWDVSTASQWLDLDGLSAETQSAITELMSQVAASLPDQMSSALSGTDIDMSDSVNSMVNSSIENVDLSGAGETLMGKVNESMNGLDMSESGAGLQDSLQTSLLTSLENVDLSGAGTTLNTKLGESLASLDMSESGSGFQESIQSSITSSIEGVDLTEAASSLNTSLSTALSSAESIDTTGFATALQSSITGSVQGIDYSGVTSAVGTGISNAITATMGTIQGAISTLYSDVGAAINSAFAAGFTTTTTVTITVNYQLANPTATISFSGGGTGTATVSASVHANGGFVNGPELSWIGEDGPEFVIPVGAKRRNRGLELWQRAGQMLGIPQHAEGGLIGNPASAATYYDYTAQNAIQAISEEDRDTSEPIPTSVRHEGESGTKEVKLNVNVNPQFIVSGGEGQSDEDIMRIIKSHFKELADDLGGELADRLGEVFSNMPVNA